MLRQLPGRIPILGQQDLDISITGVGQWAQQTLGTIPGDGAPEGESLGLCIQASALYRGPAADQVRIFDNVWTAFLYNHSRSGRQVIIIDAKLGNGVNLPSDCASIAGLVLKNVGGGTPSKYSYAVSASGGFVAGANEATLSWAYALAAGTSLSVPMPQILLPFGLGNGGAIIGTFVPPYARSVQIGNFGGSMAGGRFRLLDASGVRVTIEIDPIPLTAPGTIATAPVRPCDRFFDVTNNTLATITGFVTFQLRF